MTATARSTQNFALPATQNTAPVHEFRCLYTHDVRKKAKKWHDGSARFHTFNKRVMVYDDTKNYIGDLHYRDDEEFGEGVELQLDRGVLVEVGERIGETQTDLTGIIHKSHTNSSGHVASSTAVPRPVQRINGLNSQGRPKSLNELLGTSQGRIGRARLPATSPYEQRHAHNNIHDESPPSKRQKMVTGKENIQPSKAITALPQPAATKSLPDSSIPSSSPVSRRHPAAQKPRQDAARHLPSDRAIVDISSDEEGWSKQQPKPVTSRPNNVRAIVSPYGAASAGKDPTSTVRKTTAKSNSKRHSPKVQEEAIRPNSSIRPSSAVTVSSARSSSSLRPGMSSLKMRPSQTRRKLMYKALLPSNADNTSSNQTALTIDEQPVVHKPSQESPVSKNPGPVAEFDNDNDDSALELDGMEGVDDLNQPASPSRMAYQTPQKDNEKLYHVSESPLFVSQNTAQRSPSPSNLTIEDDFHMPPTQETPHRHSIISNDAQDSGRSIGEDHMDIIEPESPCFPPPPPARSKAPRPLSSSLMPPPQSQLLPSPVSKPTTSNQRTPSPSKSRPFARSLSANDSPLPHDPRASPCRTTLPPILESPTTSHNLFSPFRAPPPLLPVAQPHLPLPNPITNSAKSPIQRSKSDTAAIVPTTVATPGPLTTSSEEQGPWTSLEAFLLFDRWPTCKQKNKPVFEPAADFDEDDNDSIDGTDLDAVKPVQPVLIRSARSLWRDG